MIVRATRANAVWSSIEFSQPVEIRAGLGLDLGAMPIDQHLCAVGRGVAGQALAHQKAKDVGHRRGRRVIEAVQTLLLDRAFERGGQVGAHAHQRVGANRLDARLLDRLEHRPALDRLRPEAGVRRLVVVSEAQRHLVGQAADARGLLAREVARRMRQDGAMAGQLRSVTGEGDLQVRLLGERTRGVRERALEDVCRAFVLSGHAGPVI